LYLRGMKTLIAHIFFSGVCFCANGQSFAIINDPDGYVNIREGRSVTSRIVGKINNYNVFDYDKSSKSEWVWVYKQEVEDESGGIAGFVHQSRILPLSSFKTIKNTSFFKDSCVGRNDSITVVIKSSPFNPLKHKVVYTDKELEKIDGKSSRGMYRTLPKKAISSFKIIKSGIPILIPESAFDNLYEPRFKTLKIFVQTNDTFYIELDNGEGDGAYTVIWIIKGSKYFKKFAESTV